MPMPRASIRPQILAIGFTAALLSACSDGGDSTAAQTGARGTTGAASENTANGTPTGLAPAPWAMSTPQPASDGLQPPVIHTVD